MGWYILHTARTGLEKIGKVSYAQSVTVGRRGVDRAPSRCRETARMASFILKTIEPSVDASGLARCCRHEVSLYPSVVVFGMRGAAECGTMGVTGWVRLPASMNRIDDILDDIVFVGRIKEAW